MELLCQQRALDAFSLDPAKWGANVQPYSGMTSCDIIMNKKFIATKIVFELPTTKPLLLGVYFRG